MKGIMSIIEVMITGVILLVAFLHFFPQYSIRSKWGMVLLDMKVMDTINTIDRLGKTRDFATSSDDFKNFMESLFTPEALIYWKEVNGLEGYTEDMSVPYFTQGQKESIVDVTDINFQDDFDDGNDDGWTKLSDDWTVENGWYKINNNYAFTSNFSYAGVDYTNFTFESKFKIISNDYAFIYFRIVDEDNYYVAFVDIDDLADDNTTIHIRKVVGGSGVNMINDINVNTDIQLNEEHKLKVKAEGNQFRVYVDDVEYITTTDNNDPFLSGKIGLGTHHSYTYFDDVIVRGKYDVYSFTLGLGYPY